MDDAGINQRDMYGVWDYIKKNPKLFPIKLGDSKALDLTSFLLDINNDLEERPERARKLLALLANLLVATSQGQGREFYDEIVVTRSMLEIDFELRRFLSDNS
jgi:hypothetical protein